ncbi:MAG: hypothetical protein KC776_04160 [Myxococcales bacterium]|nr:hypothetical protein [Myxococcales bacterium]MCB9580024.1 hypothetical protein [Polyangiaceae bacterium]
MAVEIRETPMGGKLKDFLNVVDYIYRDDPNYVRPLDFDMKQRLSPKNPFFEHGEGTTFTAHRNGWCVGRCTAQIDQEHLERYKEDVGFFGFLDTIDDPEVAKELLDAAGRWLAQRGMKYMRGPLSLNINEEMGCLVEGFDTPPMIMMPHHRPYQGGLIEQAGLEKLKDVYAWRYTVGEVPSRAQKALEEVEKLPEVRARHVDKKNVEGDVRIIMDVFNDAWSDNWGFVPLTESELSKMAQDLKPILIPELTYIAEINGEPAAVSLALPNVNEMIQDFRGKLNPVTIGKLLWRLKVQGPNSARLIILGIRKKFRGVKKYGGLSTYLYAKMNNSAARLGVKWGELSWTLEDNAPVNVGIRFMGGKIYKRYRVYERSLG